MFCLTTKEKQTQTKMEKETPQPIRCWECGNVDRNPTFLESWTSDQFAKPCLNGVFGSLKHKLWICPQPSCPQKFDIFLAK